MKYKLWRQVVRSEYKVVEADSIEEACKQHAAPAEGFTVDSDGHILDWHLEDMRGLILSPVESPVSIRQQGLRVKEVTDADED